MGIAASDFPANLRQFVASSAADAKLDIRASFFDQLVQTVEISRPSDPAAQDFSMPPLPWATCNTFGTYRWDLPFGPTVGTYRWDIPLGHTVGTYRWNLPLRPAVGTFCWDVPLGPTVGTYRWDLPLGPTEETYR